MAVMLGGRAAELLVFDEPSTGASNDLERATETARRMVIEFGMSEKLGPVRYASPSMMYLGGSTEVRNDIGEGTAEVIDREIRRFVNEAQDSALNILREHEKILHEVAKSLQEKEVINHEEIQAFVDNEKAEAQVESESVNLEKPAENENIQAQDENVSTD